MIMFYKIRFITTIPEQKRSGRVEKKNHYVFYADASYLKPPQPTSEARDHENDIAQTFHIYNPHFSLHHDTTKQ